MNSGEEVTSIVVTGLIKSPSCQLIAQNVVICSSVEFSQNTILNFSELNEVLVIIIIGCLLLKCGSNLKSVSSWSCVVIESLSVIGQSRIFIRRYDTLNNIQTNSETRFVVILIKNQNLIKYINKVTSQEVNTIRECKCTTNCICVNRKCLCKTLVSSNKCGSKLNVLRSQENFIVEESLSGSISC